MAALQGNIKLGCFIWRTVVHCEQLRRSIELLGNERQRPALIYSVMFFWLLWLISFCRAGKVGPSLLHRRPRLEEKNREEEKGERRNKSQVIWMRLLNLDNFPFMFYTSRNWLCSIRTRFVRRRDPTKTPGENRESQLNGPRRTTFK